MKFEYLIKISPGPIELNELGRKGWELIIINKDTFYFKRQEQWKVKS